mgnify:CR=1 FL=1
MQSQKGVACKGACKSGKDLWTAFAKGMADLIPAFAAVFRNKAVADNGNYSRGKRTYLWSWAGRKYLDTFQLRKSVLQ